MSATRHTCKLAHALEQTNTAKNAMAKENRGSRIWQPYLDIIKLFCKDSVISEHVDGCQQTQPVEGMTQCY